MSQVAGGSRLERLLAWRFLDLGVRHASNPDSALRVRVVNLVLLVGSVALTALGALNVANGSPEHLWRLLPLALLIAGVATAHASGALGIARGVITLGLPLILIALVGGGFARRGTQVLLPITLIVPSLLLSVRRRRTWMALGVVTAALGAAATYCGLRWPHLPDLPAQQLPAVQALLVGVGSLVSMLLIGLTVWRQERVSVALEDALRKAGAAEEAREALLSAVSHELRTPAAMAYSLAEEASQLELSPEARELFERIHGLLGREIELLGDVIDVVALRRGEIALRPTTIELEAVLRRSVEPFRDRAADRGLQLEIRCGSEVGRRTVDADRVGQILRHLVDNAIRFTSSGTVSVSLEAETEGEFVLEVADTGPGMTPESLARLFEAFSQADVGHARSHQGLGLGLTLVRAAAQRLGASLDVHTSVGAGCRFQLRIPAPRVREAPAKRASLEGLVVLVVDDLPLNRKVLARLCQRLGAQRVVEAADGEEGVAQWRAAEPDLVLMDMQMPRMDGLEATRCIRAEGGACPIFAVTANTTPEAEHQCLEAGMDAYLTKPFSMDALLARLSNPTR